MVLDRTFSALMTQFISQIGDWWTPAKGGVAADDDTLTVEELTDQLQKEMEMEMGGKIRIWDSLFHS